MANALAQVCEGHVSELSGTGHVHIWRVARHDSSIVLLNPHRTAALLWRLELRFTCT